MRDGWIWAGEELLSSPMEFAWDDDGDEEDWDEDLDWEDEDDEDSSANQAEQPVQDNEDEARAYEQRYREGYDESEEGYYDDEDEDAGAVIDDLVDSKLERVMSLRMQGDEVTARNLLYEVLAEGNEDQKRVAMNILQQMDT